MTKPEDLKMPFDWRAPVIMIHDRVLYAPLRGVDYQTFTFPDWSSEHLFGNDNPVHIEYCSGNGAWIADKAAENPNINWVAVEKRFMRVRKIWSKVKNGNLKNLFIVCGEAYTVTSNYFPSGTVKQFFINFPDPWPKRRHARHRLIQPVFLDQLKRVASANSNITLVTDDPTYSKLAIKEIHTHGSFVSRYPEPFYITDMMGYGTSFFEELWREQGRLIHYHTFDMSK